VKRPDPKKAIAIAEEWQRVGWDVVKRHRKEQKGKRQRLLKKRPLLSEQKRARAPGWEWGRKHNKTAGNDCARVVEKAGSERGGGTCIL